MTVPQLPAMLASYLGGRPGWVSTEPQMGIGGEATSQTTTHALPDGWLLSLGIDWTTRDRIEVARWRRRMKEVVFVEAVLRFPRAEALGRACGLRGPCSMELGVEPRFEIVGERAGEHGDDRAGELQLRGRRDYGFALQRIDSYARSVALPQARKQASLANWLVEYQASDPSFAAWRSRRCSLPTTGGTTPARCSTPHDGTRGSPTIRST